MAFYPAIGWALFVLGLILSIIIYAWKRKWTPIMYLISIALYAFTISFVIDVYSLGRNWILALLALSAGLMLLLGWYLGRK